MKAKKKDFYIVLTLLIILVLSLIYTGRFFYDSVLETDILFGRKMIMDSNYENKLKKILLKNKFTENTNYYEKIEILEKKLQLGKQEEIKSMIDIENNKIIDVSIESFEKDEVFIGELTRLSNFENETNKSLIKVFFDTNSEEVVSKLLESDTNFFLRMRNPKIEFENKNINVIYQNIEVLNFSEEPRYLEIKKEKNIEEKRINIALFVSVITFGALFFKITIEEKKMGF